MRWRVWADAASAIGAAAAVLLFARGLRPFATLGVLSGYGFDVSLPRFELVWARAALPAAIVLTGLLGWWAIAALCAWALVAVEAFSINGTVSLPVAVTMLVMTAMLAALLSVPGGFRRGRALIGKGLLAIAGAGIVVALAPAAEVMLGDRATPGGGSDWLLAVDSRLAAAVSMAQLAAVLIAAVVLLVMIARPVRLRALAIGVACAALLGALLLAGDRPLGFEFGSALAPQTALPIGVGTAVVLAVASLFLVDRLLDPPPPPVA